MDGIGDKATDNAVPAWAPRRRFDVTEYHRMGDAGIFREDDPYELIEGEIIEMASIRGPHIGAVLALNRHLFLAAGDQFVVSVQSPIRLGTQSEPEPDLMLLRPRAEHYRGEIPPGEQDAVLVVEVAESSLRYDRVVKQPLYARHGIPGCGLST